MIKTSQNKNENYPKIKNLMITLIDRGRIHSRIKIKKRVISLMDKCTLKTNTVKYGHWFFLFLLVLKANTVSRLIHNKKGFLWNLMSLHYL